MSETKQGLTAAVAAIGAGEAPQGAAAAAGQSDLFEPDAPLPLQPRGASGPKGGRPAGARNRRTQEWVDFILGQYRSPLVVLAETYSRPVEELAAALGCDKLEAFKAQQAAAVALAPYLHQRQAQMVELQASTRGLLLIGDLGADGAADALSLPLAEVLENQPLSSPPPEKSDGSESRIDAKPMINNGNSSDGQ